jgi:hypothetical protein
MIRALSGLIALLIAGVASTAAAQAPANPRNDQAPAAPRKAANAARVAPNSIQVDGRLDEEAWRLATPITDFIQKEPVEGSAPSDNLEVRFAYDDSALYVGARMMSGSDIQAPMGRRDDVDQAEYFLVSLDSYLDRTTAYTFGVTASGVRLDHFHPTDNEDSPVQEFDPVWGARTREVEGEWTAELWIPLSQIRFNEQSPQIWGLNIRRWIPSRNEEVYWVLVPRTDRGWASRFGELRGIDGLQPPKRVELVPYLSGNSTVIRSPNQANPFEEQFAGTGRVGMDAKIGFGSNLTLDVTVNPDFGQVEADPAEVNLTAFETFFNERRPFFLEGSRLLQGAINSYYYSRRIGATPVIPTSGDFLDYPNTSTILGAGKLTGRLPSKTSIGILGAVTQSESARSFTLASSTLSKFNVAPTTTYGVGRVQQEFGRSASIFGLLGTAVHRDLGAGDPLSSLLTRNALSISTDNVFRFKSGEWELPVDFGFSYVDGDAAAIDRIQRSSARYLNRPDITYGGYDPTRTSMIGRKVGVGLERRNGRHWLGNVLAQSETPGLELNDLGRLNMSDSNSVRGRIQYRETRPGRWLRTYSMSLFNLYDVNKGGDRQRAQTQPQVLLTWRNFWVTNFTGTFNYRVQDMRLTRGGPLMEKPSSWLFQAVVRNSSASQTRGSLDFRYGKTEDGGLTARADTSITLQPLPRWLLSLEPSYEHVIDTQQYVTALNGGGPLTYGRRYIFGRIDRSTFTTRIRMNYTFKPDLNLDLYAEPFAASGRYDDLGELAAGSTREMLFYGTQGTTITTRADGSHDVTQGASTFNIRNVDFNTLSFRSNLVLRWEWRPGSTLYLVWQQDRSERDAVGTRATAGDLFDSFTAPGKNFFAVKASFWFALR